MPPPHQALEAAAGESRRGAAALRAAIEAGAGGICRVKSLKKAARACLDAASRAGRVAYVPQVG